MTEQPNRYGCEGSNQCRHGIELWRVCDWCNAWLDEEYGVPNLIGTGNVPDNNKETDDVRSEQEAEQS
jgi:hypothetical protein